MIALNLVYLAFIAFLPFPTALLGEYFENPLTTAIYAVNVALVSGMEVVLFSHAHNHWLLERKLPSDVHRYGVAMSLAPVFFFVLSIPIAFISTTLAACTWFVGIPFAAIAQRWKARGRRRPAARLAADQVEMIRSRPAPLAAYRAVSARAVSLSALSSPSQQQTPAEQVWSSGRDSRSLSSIVSACARWVSGSASANSSPP